MNKPSTQEALSALMDHALSRKEVDELLKQLRELPEARRKLSRYSAVSMLMREEPADIARIDLASATMLRIRESEPQKVSARGKILSDLRWLLQGWRLPAMGMAAALLAGMSVMVVRSLPDSPDASLVALKPAPTEGLRAGADQVDEAMPDPYLVQHLTYTEGLPVGSMSSGVRLVAYERP